MKWEDLTSVEFDEAIEKSEGVCIMPIGCLERHGEHIVVGCDSYTVNYLANLAAENEYAVVFPTGFWLGEVVPNHSNDAEMLKDPELNGSEFFGLEFACLGSDRELDDGEILPLGRVNIEVFSTPGHTPGSVCYDCGDKLICGDTIFSSGYGRYDLPGGDGNVLFSSLKKLAARRDDPMIYPGHGASCSLSAADVIRTLRYKYF